jgi:hypothetical protein
VRLGALTLAGNEGVDDAGAEALGAALGAAAAAAADGAGPALVHLDVSGTKVGLSRFVLQRRHGCVQHVCAPRASNSCALNNTQAHVK